MVECSAAAWKPDLGVRYHALASTQVTNIDAGSVEEPKAIKAI